MINAEIPAGKITDAISAKPILIPESMNRMFIPARIIIYTTDNSSGKSAPLFVLPIIV